jgi:hypothetical protein
MAWGPAQEQPHPRPSRPRSVLLLMRHGPCRGAAGVVAGGRQQAPPLGLFLQAAAVGAAVPEVGPPPEVSWQRVLQEAVGVVVEGQTSFAHLQAALQHPLQRAVSPAAPAATAQDHNVPALLWCDAARRHTKE